MVTCETNKIECIKQTGVYFHGFADTEGRPLTLFYVDVQN